MNRKSATHEDVTARIRNVAEVVRVAREDALRVLREHALAGRRIPIWRDNQVVWASAAAVLAEREAAAASDAAMNGDSHSLAGPPAMANETPG